MAGEWGDLALESKFKATGAPLERAREVVFGI
jgi:hypothetical protein